MPLKRRHTWRVHRPRRSDTLDGAIKPYRYDCTELIVSASPAPVVAVAQHPREPERDASRVARGALQAVERDLDDLLGPDVHDVGAAVGG